MTRSLANKDEPGLAGKDRAASINLFPFSISLSPKQVSETTWWFGSCETWSRPANRVGPSARPSSLGPERERQKNRKTQRRTQKKVVAKGLDNEPTSKDRARRASGTNTWHCLDQTIVWRRGDQRKDEPVAASAGATVHMLTIKGHAALDWPAASMLPPGKPQTSCR